MSRRVVGFEEEKPGTPKTTRPLAEPLRRSETSGSLVSTCEGGHRVIFSVLLAGYTKEIANDGP